MGVKTNKYSGTQTEKNLEEIVKAADGIMVARGDLGVEARMEELPYLQKMLIKTRALQGM